MIHIQNTKEFGRERKNTPMHFLCRDVLCASDLHKRNWENKWDMHNWSCHLHVDCSSRFKVIVKLHPSFTECNGVRHTKHNLARTVRLNILYYFYQNVYAFKPGYNILNQQLLLII